MRPVRLEVAGFTVFRTPTVVDFEGADLFALAGPTGAGKTSIIDALTFALYGSVPRLDDRRAVAPVISQNLTEARVRLDFTVGGERYTAARVVRATRAGGATTREARLERGAEVLAGQADEVTEAVSRLLGLNFEHFTTCVSLPQGQFARFLHDKPSRRQDLLVKLLDLGLYERVAAAARARREAARVEADLAGGQLGRLAAATPEARQAAAERAGALARLEGRLAGERPRIEAIEGEIAAARAAADEVGRQLALLDRLAAPDGVAELAAELAEADRVRRRCAELFDEASEAVADAEADLAALPDRAVLDGWQRDHGRRPEAAALVARGEAAAAAAAGALAAAADAVGSAEAALAQAAAGREQARLAQAAQALVPALVPGEPCPVCARPVETLPDHAPPADLVAADRAVADAERSLRTARDAHDRAQTERARVDEKLARARDELAALDHRLVGAPPADRVERDLALVEAATRALDKARQAERDARRAAVAASAHHEAVAGREVEARRAFDDARDAVASLGPPPAERRDLAADWATLVRWAAERAPALAERLAEHRRTADDRRGRMGEVLGAVASACAAAGVEVPEGRWPGEVVAAERARAEARLAQIDDQLAEAERLREQQRSAVERQRVADLLAANLAANRFEKWLLDEAVQQLVATASTLLGELTAGAYALATDARSGGFGVVDHTHASQVRSARTLSGGETFLASLALALALAEQVAGLAAGGAARLESLFLDEGFGTLDPETLDVVASALDELGSRGRMVGVVTHVRELAERLPVRFEVRKLGGSAVVERVEV